MTQYIRARFSTATRFGVAILTAVILALMNGDRPAGQIATLTNADRFRRHQPARHVWSGNWHDLGAGRIELHDRVVVQTERNNDEFHNDQQQHGRRAIRIHGSTRREGSGRGGRLRGRHELLPRVQRRSGVYTLAADFEEGAGQLQPGHNHALISPTTINDNMWYHAAATYDSTTSGCLRLYLNGVLDKALRRTFPSVQARAPDSTASSMRRSGRAMPPRVELLRLLQRARSTRSVSGTLHARSRRFSREHATEELRAPRV